MGQRIDPTTEYVTVETNEGELTYSMSDIWDRLDGVKPLVGDDQDEAFFRAVLVGVFCGDDA